MQESHGGEAPSNTIVIRVNPETLPSDAGGEIRLVESIYEAMSDVFDEDLKVEVDIPKWERGFTATPNGASPDMAGPSEPDECNCDFCRSENVAGKAAAFGGEPEVDFVAGGADEQFIPLEDLDMAIAASEGITQGLKFARTMAGA